MAVYGKWNVGQPQPRVCRAYAGRCAIDLGCAGHASRGSTFSAASVKKTSISPRSIGYCTSPPDVKIFMCKLQRYHPRMAPNTTRLDLRMPSIRRRRKRQPCAPRRCSRAWASACTQMARFVSACLRRTRLALVLGQRRDSSFVRSFITLSFPFSLAQAQVAQHTHRLWRKKVSIFSTRSQSIE